MSDVTIEPSTSTKLIAEALGTFLLLFGAVGTALFASDFGVGDNGTSLGVGFVGVALAFGLTILAGVYTWGPISGGHFNPAVTIGLAAAGRFEWRNVPGYIVAQIVGGAVGTTLLFLIGVFGPGSWLSEKQAAGFASNGFGDLSPGGFGLGSAIVAEILFTAIFVLVILGVTHSKRGTGFAGVAIGLTLTLIHLASIPIDNTSVNPARSIATAIYGGGGFLAQLWVFIVFPIVGALLAGYAHRALFEPKALPPAQAEARVE
ncbi:aquaporin Z [Microbacterium fluvii]|uniref:Aquaporin Z n=1 Tax=Microbacterium fluvii TaxID=415215 RepID=A0ABW2HBK9_9MICO|nr:aquaporin Z [Microbacterium fluvii]MCU4671450.1 aquaporin Z [Microbacterium fluvii]